MCFICDGMVAAEDGLAHSLVTFLRDTSSGLSVVVAGIIDVPEMVDQLYH